MDPSTILAEVCGHLAHGDRSSAAEILRAEYPFVPVEKAPRKATLLDKCRVFLRDGFIDRYTGQRLVFPAVLRIISAELPAELPYTSNWDVRTTHVAYWTLFPTVDHLHPVAAGGFDNEANWVTTSMLTNKAKGNATRGQLGWELHPPGDLGRWDGLTDWLLAYLEQRPDLATGYVGSWVRPLRSCL